MTLFQKRLVKGVIERLENRKFRYIDNSLAYYSDPVPANMQEDKEWFAKCRFPSPQKLLAQLHYAIMQEGINKSRLYDLLADSHSRETLLLVSLYALLGHRFVKFPYYGAQTLQRREQLRQRYAVADAEPIPANRSALSYPLHLYRFPLAAEEITCYCTAEFLYQAVYSPQYRYAFGPTTVDVNRGDHVLDCGACVGDTALYFAAKAGPQGRVVSFEPHPTLGEIWQTNRQLNPRLAPHMELMPVATSNECGTTTFSLSGPGSHMGGGNSRLQQVTVRRMTLDEAAQGLGMDRVDMIKMDVEGAELETLQGATGLLRRHRPRLAVCLYHKPQDHLEIPAFLHGLDLGYRFYLEHHFVNAWETVLYALPE